MKLLSVPVKLIVSDFQISAILLLVCHFGVEMYIKQQSRVSVCRSMVVDQGLGHLVALAWGWQRFEDELVYGNFVTQVGGKWLLMTPSVLHCQQISVRMGFC